jgi:putative transposase
MADHVHVMHSILPKYSVSQVAGFIKGKSAIQMARNFQGMKKNFAVQNFWAGDYY